MPFGMGSGDFALIVVAAVLVLVANTLLGVQFYLHRKDREDEEDRGA